MAHLIRQLPENVMQREPESIHADPALRLAPPELKNEESRCQLLSWLIVGVISFLIFIV